MCSSEEIRCTTVANHLYHHDSHMLTRAAASRAAFTKANADHTLLIADDTVSARSLSVFLSLSKLS